MSSSPKHILPYRSALDGLRALAVLAVMAFHFTPHLLPGGWLGVDLFFVLSGFLITSLLLREYHRWGGIALRRFWVRRLRRLLPAVVLMLLVSIIAAIFLMPLERRESLSLAALATFFYVANWYFLASDEQYFAQMSMPSPLRHTWSLGIEEQFYWLFPLIFLLLGWVLHKRFGRSLHRSMGWAFMAGAIASVLWMWHLYEPGLSPDRVYYGTDTRAFELLFGAALASFSARTQWGLVAARRQRPDNYPAGGPLISQVGSAWQTRLVHLWAVLGLGVFVYAIYFLDADTGPVFTWGLPAVSLAVCGPVLLASSSHPGWFGRVFGNPVFRWIGLLSYSLYLWHWPVKVYLAPFQTSWSLFSLVAVNTVTTFVLAYLSYRFVELPIRQRGVRAWLPAVPRLPRLPKFGIPIVLLSVVGLFVGVYALPSMPKPLYTQEMNPLGRNISGSTAYAPTHNLRKIVVLGNSVPASVAENFSNMHIPDLQPWPAVSFGCEPFSGQEISFGKLRPRTQVCHDFNDRYWVETISKVKPDMTIFFVPISLGSDWVLDGKRYVSGTPEHRDFVFASLDSVRKRALQAGSKSVGILNQACHYRPLKIDGRLKRYNDLNDMRSLNRVVQAWADERGVPVFDQFSWLCSRGYSGRINGIPLYSDGLHFTKASSPYFWAWLAPQVHAQIDREKQKR